MPGGGNGTWPEPPNYFDVPKTGYKVILEKPTFPVIYPEPTINQAITNMRLGHWYTVGAFSGVGAVLGYALGSKIYSSKPAMYFGLFMFGKSALLHTMGDSAYRLMGLNENGREIQNNMPAIMKREMYN
ncbi:MAG: hypothetical protein WDW38_000098 [Sanguina aurantia]